MRNKTAPIKIWVTEETKRKLKEKSNELGLSLTGFLEKIANEPVVFMDKNVSRILRVLNSKK